MWMGGCFAARRSEIGNWHAEHTAKWPHAHAATACAAEMTSRQYATLDRNRMGPGLLLSESDMQVTTSIACDGARKILGTAPAMAGDYAYECYVWSTSQGDLTGLVSIGIAQPDSVLDAAVGKDAKSIGLWLADGLVKENDVTLGTVAAQGERVCIGVLLHLNPVSAWVEWYANGSLLYHADLTTGLAWALAIGIGSGTAGDRQEPASG